MAKSYDIERTSQGFDIDEADQEIERLRAEVRLIVEERDRTFALMLDRAEKAEANNEKLRAALEKISQYSSNPAGSGLSYAYCGEMVRTARAALKGKQ